MAKDQAVPETERRFSQKQYDFLKECSEKGEEGIKEWNEWREQNPADDICLDGRDFRSWYLRGVNLMHGRCSYMDERGEIDYSGQVYLREANFHEVKAEGACFDSAHLQGTCWPHARLHNATFHSAHLNEARLGVSRLDGCIFSDACLRGAQLTASAIRRAKFSHTDLRACSARTAIVDGETRLWECQLDRETDFTGVGLGSVIVDPATRQLLEYNIRRKNWEHWYVGNKSRDTSWATVTSKEKARRLRRARLRWCKTSLVHLFWFMSDYGRSTKRIIGSFLILSLIFAVVYCLWPSMLTGLTAGTGWRRLLHCLYFSVVTMTTLGFGDIAANPDSWQGQVLLMAQVILGYVLLGALVTRFAVLFTAGGPAGRFSESPSDGSN